jgi:hypothetical protein
MDSGASHTMCSNRNWFQQFSTLTWNIPVVLGDNSTIQGISQGRVHIWMHTRNEWSDVILQNVLYVPELHGNLLSVSHLTSCGADVQFAGQAAKYMTRAEALSAKVSSIKTSIS